MYSKGHNSTDWISQELVKEFHIDRGLSINRISNQLNTSPYIIENKLGRFKMTADQLRWRREKYLRRRAREIHDPEAHERRVQQCLEEVENPADYSTYDEDQISEAKWLALNTDLTNGDISEHCDITSSQTITHLRTGRSYEDLEPQKPDDLKTIKEKYEVEEVDRSKNRQRARYIKWEIQNTNKLGKDIARKYNVTSGTVSNIKHDKTWEDLEPKQPNDYEGS